MFYRSQKELQEERDGLLKRINEKIIETEELRHARDSLDEKVRQKENDITELRKTNTRLEEELREIKLKVSAGVKQLAIVRVIRDRNY